ncbi:MAG: alpha/beta hydrolase [Campylobacterota bacterium]|nr:alpha/beta hydrolase [Campylobacterota bacterium]
MKILWLILLSINILFANHLIVKEGDVTLLINNNEVNVPKDHNLTLNPGTMVCFLKGSGKVFIDKKLQLSNKEKGCYQIPVGDDFNIKKLALSSEDDVMVTSKKESTSGTRGVNTSLSTGSEEEVIISSSSKEVIIYDESYGPLPVTLSIKKSDGTTMKDIVNEDSAKTFFRIPAGYLDNGSKIEVTNAFGDKLLDKKVGVAHSYKMEEHGQVFYEKGNHTIVDILYGTDRKTKNKQTDLEEYYTGERGKLKFGVAQVSIPKKHEFGEIERPNKFFNQKEKIGEHVIVTKLENINREAFHKFLKSKLDYVDEKDILVFIHGFNVTFASAIRRTAQISYDLNFKGVPMTYSWPSQGSTSEYMKDESSVQYTVPHLVAFLKEVIDNKGEANLHVIGHSMGTRALTNALKEISYIYSGKQPFKNIILAASDIDKDVFAVSLFPYIIKTTDKITLYASSDDAALKLSKTLHGGERIGQGGDDIIVFKGLDTIDATGIDTSLLGHSYFAEKKILVKDLKDVIHKSLPPSKRDSLIEKIKKQMAYWKFRLDNL